MFAGTDAYCQLCHEKSNGGKSWNGYGYDIKLQRDGGAEIGPAITAVEGLDSDGSGFSNLAEITADAQPGWVPGAVNQIYNQNGPTNNSTEPPPAGVSPLDPPAGNSPPVANDDAAYATDEDAPLSIAAPGVLTNDTDPDVSDTLTAVLDSGPSNADSFALNADGSFNYTPTPDFAGTDTFTYFANDGTVNSTLPATVTITVNAVNDAPSFTLSGGNQAVNEDAGAQAVAGFATGMSPGGGADEAGQALSFNVSTSNDPLFAVLPAINATTGELTYTPADDANGSAIITVTLSDDGGTPNGGADTSAAQNFTITVNPVNDPPVAAADSYSVNEDDTLTVTVPGVLGNDTDADLDTLTAVLDSNVSNGPLITLNPDGSFSYAPNGDFAGSDSFTYHANDTIDDSNIVSVTITVDPVNDAPSFTLIGGNQAVDEDAGAQAVAGFAAGMSPGGGADEAGQALSFNVSTDNDPLFAVLPAINATTGELTYTPAADANGSAIITVTLSDDGGTANGGADTSGVQNFTITVNPVNDAPSFVVGSNQAVTENAGAQTVAGFATGISPGGGTDEAGQGLTFNVVNDNNGLFAVQPAIDASGELTYTPAADTTGSATVDVTLSDDGGTANGGADTSAAQNFTITVNAAGNGPTVQASNLSTEFVASKSARILWTESTDGVGSIVTIRPLAAARVLPVDGVGGDYVADNNYDYLDENANTPPDTQGGSQNYVVYKGTGNSINVYGLQQNTDYVVTVYAWDGLSTAPEYNSTVTVSPPAAAVDANEIQITTDGPAMHNYNGGLNCDDCHNNHGGSGFIPRGTGAESLCTGCHSPQGQLATLREFTLHHTPTEAYDADDIDCGSCHEVHFVKSTGNSTTYSTDPNDGSSGFNLSYIRANVGKYMKAYWDFKGEPNNLNDAVYHDATDLAHEGLTNDSIPVTPAGICQSCHTQTSYHKYGGTTEAEQCHQGGGSDTCLVIPADVVCTTCHKHESSFAGAGGDCTSCHNDTQGPRRNVVQEFGATWGGVNGSSHIAENSLTATDCEVCHAQDIGTPQHEHGLTGTDKKVTLYNADNLGTAYQTPSAYGDVLASFAEADALRPHCLSCHDTNGANAQDNTGAEDDNTPSSPFTDSGAPFDINATWQWSSHGNVTERAVGQQTGDPLTCLGDGTNGCHGSGHGSKKKLLLGPADTASSTPSLTEEEEGLCFNCHISGGSSSVDIETFFLGTETTDGNGGTDFRVDSDSQTPAKINQKHDVLYTDQQYSGGFIECKSCHRPHEDNNTDPVAIPGTSPSVGLRAYTTTNTYTYPDPTNPGVDPDITFSYSSDAGSNLDPQNPEACGSTPGCSQQSESDYIEFCLTCHDGVAPPGVTVPASLVNIAEAYDVNDQHGRQEAGTRVGKGTLKPPWNTAGVVASGPYAALNCNTCHSPHGTENIHNLRSSITVAGVAMEIGGETGSGFSTFSGTTYILPVEAGSQTDHKWGAWCTFCHELTGHSNYTEATTCNGPHMHGGSGF
jgi:hypothetical protein